MTKEELKQEAKEYADKYGKSNFDLWDTARFAYYQGAEPREKRIAELEDKLANADYQLEGRDNEIRELKAQIEKMKSDVKQLREDRMNDDTDQNIMDRLWKEWTVNFGASN